MTTPVGNKTKITIPHGTPIHLYMDANALGEIYCTKPDIYTIDETHITNDRARYIYYIKYYSTPRVYTGTFIPPITYNKWIVWEADLL